MTSPGQVAMSGLGLKNQVAVGDGSVGVPSIGFSNDTNTGIYRAGADVVGVVTGGADRMVIASSSSMENPNMGSAVLSSSGDSYTLNQYSISEFYNPPSFRLPLLFNKAISENYDYQIDGAFNTSGLPVIASYTNGIQGYWVDFEYPNGQILTSYSLQVSSRTDQNRTQPTHWNLFVSNDKTNWIQIDIQTGQSFGSSELKTYNVSGAKAGRFFRWLITRKGADSIVSIRMDEFKLFTTPVEVSVRNSFCVGGQSFLQNLDVLGNLNVLGLMNFGIVGYNSSFLSSGSSTPFAQNTIYGGLSLSYTPKYADSKLLILANGWIGFANDGLGSWSTLWINRDGNQIATSQQRVGYGNQTNIDLFSSFSITEIIAANSTSPTTFQIMQINGTSGNRRQQVLDNRLIVIEIRIPGI